MNNNYVIKNVSANELEKTAVEWAAKEGWNPGLYDAECFYAIDPKGLFVGYLDDKPISCITSVAYDDTFGFLGFYIVVPDERGKGYGYKLWQESLKHFTNQNIGLDGVVAQQENYKKSGFKLAYRNIRYEGISTKCLSHSLNIVDYDDSFFDSINEYDQQVFPTKRTEFLKKWLNQPESIVKIFWRNDKVKGYGMIRKCRKGYKIGPLFAYNLEIACELLESLSSSIPEKSQFYLDIPEPNKSAIELVEANKMKHVFETARMYTKEEPRIDMSKQFGITTFEVG